MQQDMMGWQQHQLDQMDIIFTSLQTDNHISTPSVNFLQAMPKYKYKYIENF